MPSLLLRIDLLSLCGVAWLGCGAQPAPPPPTVCQALTDAGGGVTVGSGLPGDPAIPTRASGYRAGKAAATARSYLVVTANPLASRAGCEVLEAGGTAVDAAVAVQLVLGLVEPQSTGIGGGGFLVHYDARTGAVQAYDGRETAPAAATEGYLAFVDDATDRSPPQPTARASGRSIGTPGALRMLELAYRDHGRTAWPALFEPAIRLATEGFPIGGRLAAAIGDARLDLQADPEAAATYLTSDGTGRQLGAVLAVPAYAATLAAIASGGADALYTGELARAIVDKIASAQGAAGGAITPGKTTLADLAGYQAKRRDPICTRYRAYWICGMPPPSSGGLAVAEALGVLESFELGAAGPTAVDREGGVPDVTGVHLVAEAERLAYADRDRYVADTDFVALPGGSIDALVSRSYLASRAGLVRLTASLGTAPAGALGAPALGVDAAPDHGTSHATIVDGEGNVVAMTTSVESSFGSFHMARGVVLNNQLTDFSALPTDEAGAPIANRVAAGKRPRSSMAPTLVFRAAADGSRGDFVLATGSPGGSAIIQYVVKALVGTLDWGLDAQQAAGLLDFGAANDPTTNLGGEHPALHSAAGDRLVSGLRALGHTVNTGPQTSGIATVSRTASGALVGGADPRREGVPLGDW